MVRIYNPPDTVAPSVNSAIPIICNDPVIADAVCATDALIAFVAQLDVTFRDPVIKCAELVSSAIVPVVVIVPPDNPFPAVIDVTPAPGAHDALMANDAVVGVNVIDVAALAVVANELDIASLAQLLVPNNEPVIPRLTFKEPVIIVLPDTISPFRATNSFAMRYPT